MQFLTALIYPVFIGPYALAMPTGTGTENLLSSNVSSIAGISATPATVNNGDADDRDLAASLPAVPIEALDPTLNPYAQQEVAPRATGYGPPSIYYIECGTVSVNRYCHDVCYSYCDQFATIHTKCDSCYQVCHCEAYGQCRVCSSKVQALLSEQNVTYDSTKEYMYREQNGTIVEAFLAPFDII